MLNHIFSGLGLTPLLSTISAFEEPVYLANTFAILAVDLLTIKLLSASAARIASFVSIFDRSMSINDLTSSISDLENVTGLPVNESTPVSNMLSIMLE